MAYFIDYFNGLMDDVNNRKSNISDILSAEVLLSTHRTEFSNEEYNIHKANICDAKTRIQDNG